MADVSFDAEFVEQQCWAYLTTVLNFPEVSAAALMGSWANESGRGSTTPDPTSIEGIFDEALYIGPKKQAASSNWGAYGPTVAISSFYTARDGVTYPGMGMWGITGNNVLTLFDEAKKIGQQWYDLAPQLNAWKRTYLDQGLDSGRTWMLSKLKSGEGDIATLTSYAYGLIAYGSPYPQPSAASSASRIYDKHKGKKYTYTGSSSGGSNKLEEFVQIALGYEGTTEAQWNAKWLTKNPKWVDPRLWCSEFVSACGEEADIIGEGKAFIGGKSGAEIYAGVKKCGGQIHEDDSYEPKRGDIVLFNYSGGKVSSSGSDHTGLVTEFKDGKVYTIEGNYGGSVELKYTVQQGKYWRKQKVFGAFCTPNWDAVGGAPSSSSGFGISGNLFNELCTREDAILREAAYLETVYEFKDGKKQIKEYKASEKPTDIKLSLVNYSELFQTFWKVGVPSINEANGASISGEYDYSKLDSKVRTIVQYLVGKGLNNAAACGICGNIKAESNFNTAAIGDNGTSFGICQWHASRGDAMKSMAGQDWSNNLTGQLDYLWHELESSYSGVLSALKAVENPEEGCKQAADIFVRRFEIPANVDAQSLKRQENALEYFKQITQIVSSSGSTFNSVNYANLSQSRKDAVRRAHEEIGKPYVWGATGPDSYDCSGLVGYCLTGSYSRLGTTGTFINWPQTQNPQPGDVCVVHNSSSQHTGLYIGDGKMIHAPCEGQTVQEASVQNGMIYTVYPGFQ